MTHLCDPSSDDDCREKERDAPAIADMPSIWRWLRALSNLRIRPASRLKRSHKRQRAIRIHLVNAYLLKDIGLARMEDDDIERLRPFLFRSQEED